MIVLDASAAVELLLQTRVGVRVADRALAQEESIHAPHLLDVEVSQVVRRFALAGELSLQRAEQALSDLADLPVTRHSHTDLIARIWSLRDSLSPYDAAYVALAEALDASLLTTDAKLARAHGHTAKIEPIQ